MKRRIFIAINLPENIKKQILNFREKWDFLPVRWTKKDSLHLTLVFIGYISDDELYDVCKAVREAAKECSQFQIEFEKILYGPPNKPARMIWLIGRPNDDLARLRRHLEKTLNEIEGLGGFGHDYGLFSPHITLARLNMGQWRRLAQPPKVEQAFGARFSVFSIEVMESDLKHDGAEYSVLESCPLG